MTDTHCILSGGSLDYKQNNSTRRPQATRWAKFLILVLPGSHSKIFSFLQTVADPVDNPAMAADAATETTSTTTTTTTTTTNAPGFHVSEQA